MGKIPGVGISVDMESGTGWLVGLNKSKSRW